MADTIMQDDVNGIVGRACDTFRGPLSAQPVRSTFERHHTPIVFAIAALDEAFADTARETQWRAFLLRNQMVEPQTLRETIHVIAPFALPVLESIADAESFEARWEPEGPWLAA